MESFRSLPISRTIQKTLSGTKPSMGGLPDQLPLPRQDCISRPDVLGRLQQRGIAVEFVTLHVGAATFRPVRDEKLEEIRLESEIGSISASAAERISSARREGRRVVAVGTTTTRLLEGVYLKHQGIVATSEPIDLFIRPPFQFNAVDALITNFHLPRSTLLMLVSAFAGRDLVLKAYAHAVQQGYRFYSFGDAMLIE